MKRLIPMLMIMSLVLLFSACSKDDDSLPTVKGLVSFKQNPVYTTNKISFSIQIQFGGGGKAVDIEYKLLDGSSVIASGKSTADNNPDGLKLFYETSMVEITIDSNALKGKTLTVHLDPDNKLTLQEYTTDTYVNLYKKASVQIPQ
jgi:hypothetical protein